MIGDIQSGVPRKVGLGNISYERHYLVFFTALTALEILSTDSEEEFDTCGLQYPDLLISILHVVARILGCNCKSFCLLNVDKSGKHRK